MSENSKYIVLQAGKCYFQEINNNEHLPDGKLYFKVLETEDPTPPLCMSIAKGITLFLADCYFEDEFKIGYSSKLRFGRWTEITQEEYKTITKPYLDIIQKTFS